jgi:hypothetical protein
MKLSELSIADLKAGLDYIEKQKADRIDSLKEEGLDTKEDIGLKTLSQIEFDLSRTLDTKILRFKRDYYTPQ